MAISAKKLRAILEDPYQFIPLLPIITEQGELIPFDDPYDEQMELLPALIGEPEIYVVKARQEGVSTITRAYNFWYGYTCPDPIRELVVSHEADSTLKMHRMNEEFLDGLARLDDRLRRPLKASNRIETILADTKVMFRCLTAGGRGGGKSWTYQRSHLTEVGSWPENIASALWASLDATQHPGPHYKKIVESTGHGSKTFFADLIDKQLAVNPDSVKFFPWFKHKNYATRPPDGFDDMKDDEERFIQKLHNLTDAQLYWRRLKLGKFTPIEFKHNYPATIVEAFMDEAGSYFPQELLSLMFAQSKNMKALKEGNGLRIFKLPEASTRYIIGVDSASGIGQDYAAVQVISEDFDLCATFHNNRTKPEDLADIACEIGLAYNGALAIVEDKGKQGGVTYYRMKTLGYRNLWLDEQGRPWDTGFVSKAQSYSYARRLMQDAGLTIPDLGTIRELMSIEQDAAGHISAPTGKHDDLADAYVFALWASRSLTSARLWTQSRQIASSLFMRRLPGHPF